MKALDGCSKPHQILPIPNLDILKQLSGGLLAFHSGGDTPIHVSLACGVQNRFEYSLPTSLNRYSFERNIIEIILVSKEFMGNAYCPECFGRWRVDLFVSISEIVPKILFRMQCGPFACAKGINEFLEVFQNLFGVCDLRQRRLGFGGLQRPFGSLECNPGRASKADDREYSDSNDPSPSTGLKRTRDGRGGRDGNRSNCNCGRYGDQSIGIRHPFSPTNVTPGCEAMA